MGVFRQSLCNEDFKLLPSVTKSVKRHRDRSIKCQWKSSLNNEQCVSVFSGRPAEGGPKTDVEMVINFY